MEKRVIDPEKRKEAGRLTTRVIIAITAVIILYVAYALVTKNMNVVVFEVLLMIFVIAYVVMNDFVEPRLLGIFENMTVGQRSGFLKILALDAVGAGAVLYWILGMGAEENAGGSILPLVIYIVTVQMKRKFRPEFEGTEEDEDAAKVSEEGNPSIEEKKGDNEKES